MLQKTQKNLTLIQKRSELAQTLLLLFKNLTLTNQNTDFDASNTLTSRYRYCTNVH
jgi:hypothetical protein